MLADVYVKIQYNFKQPKKTKIITNARNKERVLEILEGFVSANIGQGKDTSAPIEREEYEIIIGIDLSSDTFHVTSNTGNKGLTCGIIMDIIANIDGMDILN